MDIFRYDSDFWVTAGKITDLAILNFLCLILCLPVITAGPALAARSYVIMKLRRGEEPVITKAFFKAFKENFKQGMIIFLILGAITAVIIVDWTLIYQGLNQGIILTGMLALFSVMVALTLYVVFPMIARFKMSTVEAVRGSLIFGLANFPRVILGVFVFVLPFIIGIWYYKWSLLIWLFIRVVGCYYDSGFFVKKFAILEEKSLRTAGGEGSENEEAGDLDKIESDESEESEDSDDFDDSENITPMSDKSEKSETNNDTELPLEASGIKKAKEKSVSEKVKTQDVTKTEGRKPQGQKKTAANKPSGKNGKTSGNASKSDAVKF